MIALRGYSSESLEREIGERFDGDEEYTAIYVGDFDPSGIDIERNVRQHVDEFFVDWERVAITSTIIDAYLLPENPGKVTDTRARSFAAEYGRLVQVEVEALAPDDLRALIQRAVDAYWDYPTARAILEAEKAGREKLRKLVEEPSA